MLTYRLPNDWGDVEITDEVVNRLCQHRQTDHEAPESGGQLFARLDGRRTVVCRATGPARTDRRGRFFFTPSRIRERREIRKLFREGLHYVGDWHTHPEDVPKPSRMDQQSMADTFQKSKHELRALLLVIVGRRSPPDGFWVAAHTAGKSTVLALVPTAD